MTPQNNLEHNGNFRLYPLAELLVEISHAGLSGSLRLSRQDRKSIIYFEKGIVVYAVSNAKTHRLFNVLLKRSIIDQKALADIPNFTSDLELAAALAAKGILGKSQIDSEIAFQVESVIVDALTWVDGEWTFSPLARVRSDLVFQIDLYGLLLDFARCTPSNVVTQRFRSLQESFARTQRPPAAVALQLHESFTLECFNGQPLTIDALRNMSAMPESDLLQALYVLWLGGFLHRKDWNSAFTPAKLAEILSAKVSVVKNAADLDSPTPEPAAEPDELQPPPAAAERIPEIQITLDEYLGRMGAAETHYDMLGVDSAASIAEIKSAYFGLAKLFHPDRYHRIEPASLKRIQTAFTDLAYAYETLKHAESRETYDYKVRKELERREKRKAEGMSEVLDSEEQHSEHGLENFEQGLSLLADEEYAAAAACLARAVHYNPQNALYHAYYGKALSASTKYRHKAESEFQAAVKLEPRNTKIRMMLVEFFVELNLKKRAEGELTRFLELVPDSREAAEMLAGLKI